MAIKSADGKTFYCSICGKPYYNSAHADACRNAHDMLYIPISKTDLNRLLHLVLMSDMNLISDEFVQTLQKYQKSQFRS